MEGVDCTSLQNVPLAGFEIDATGCTFRTSLTEERFRSFPTEALEIFQGIQPLNFYVHPGIYGFPDLTWLPQTAVPDWKKNILFFTKQMGISMNDEGVVLPGSYFASWLNRCIFGCQKLPTELINSFIWKWKREPHPLEYLRIGFKEKAVNKRDLATACFAGVKYVEVWSPLRQDAVSYSGEDFFPFVVETGANRNHSAVFITLSEDDSRLLVIAIGYHHLAFQAVSLKGGGDYFAFLFTINFITNIWKDVHVDKEQLQKFYRRIRNKPDSFESDTASK